VGRLNFPAHAHIARLAVGDDPAVLFGAVLPDLTGMAGARFERTLPDAVEVGRLLHHRADERFHDHPAFRSGVAALRSALREQGFGSGPSRAGAHLGYELLLDTCLPWDDALPGALTDALTLGAGLAGGLPDAVARLRWTSLLGRLRGVQWSNLATTSDAELAARVQAILSRRPRLALPDAGDLVVAVALTAARPGIERDSEALFTGVAAALVA
jgi:acyl carrier protein phosphodiesterase